MAVMDEFQKERESVKDQSLKKKISYFWYYYKWHVIAIILVIVLGGSLIKDMVTSKDYAMFGIFLNAYTNSADTEPFAGEFAEYAGIDTEEFDVMFDNSFRMGTELDESGLSSSQMIMVYTAAQDLDVMTMDPFNFNKYAYNDSYMDLRQILTEDELAQLEGNLFYIDSVVAEEVARINEEMLLDQTVEYPDHSDPSVMEDPIPVGISLNISEKFNEYYTYGDTEGFFGVVLNTKHTDYVRAMIDYLFELE